MTNKQWRNKLQIGVSLAMILVMLVTAWPVAALDDSERKVVVGALTQLQEFEPQLHSRDFQSVSDFVEQYRQSHLSAVTKTLSQVLNESTEFSSSEQFELITLLADLYGELNQHQNAILSLQNLFLLNTDIDLLQRYQLEMKLSNAYQRNGQYHSAVDSATAAYQVAIELASELNQVLSAKHLADLFAEIEQWDPASHWLKVAKQTSVKWQDTANLIWLYLEKSQWHEQKGEMYLAIQAVKRAIAIAKEKQLRQIQFSAQMRLAELYRLQYQIAHAEPLLQELFEKAQRSRNRGEQFWVLHEIVELQIGQLKFSEAQSYLDASEKLRRYVYLDDKAGDELNAQIQWQRARVFDGLGKSEAALAALLQSEVYLSNPTMLQFKAKLMTKVGTAEQVHQAYTALKDLELNQRSESTLHTYGYLLSIAREQIAIAEQTLSSLNQKLDGVNNKLQAQSQFSANLLFCLIVLLHLIAAGFLYLKFEPKRRWIRLHKDELTQCFNARYINAQGSRLIARDAGFSLVMFDLDEFERINESLGFEQGDRIMAEIANCVSSLMFGKSELIRIGGDRFCVLAPSFSEQQAYVLAQRIRLELNKLGAQIQSKSLNITASCAVVTSDHNHSVEKLLSAAKLALSVAKKQGKDRTEIVYLD